MEYEADALVWVSDPTCVWRPGRVLSSTSEALAVELATNCGAEISPTEEEGLTMRVTIPLQGLSGSSEQPVPAGSDRDAGGEGVRVMRRNAALVGDGALRFDNLTHVPELHEAAVLHALHARFFRGVIYTLSGPVLLALNPFRALPGLYGPDELRRFLASSEGVPLQPHIFGIAAQALRGIREHHRSQTVLISGESGAGKTETTKFVMQFLATAGAERDVKGGRMSRVERQVLASNPLLEAFGNAKTLRNDNSSRFGKYIELQFGTDESTEVSPRLVGARVHTYLLEKVRVIRQADGERSFHIFYQALAAANTPTRLARLTADGLQLGASATPVATPRESLGQPPRGVFSPHAGDDMDLSGFAGLSASSFAYLRGRAGSVPPNKCDAGEFEATLAALKVAGVGTSEASELFAALAAVCHLGNVQFTALNSEASEVAKGEGEPLEVVCKLLGMSSVHLREALCSRSMQAPGESRVIRMENTVEKAEESRDALARHLYDTVFKHVVRKANQSVSIGDRVTFCGVLDIFGFEYFAVNSFEQLCINYTNELLQQYFNTFIFENEAALYEGEGLAWKPQEFPDNSGIVALLQERVVGIFPMLEEECFVSNGSSSSWHNKLVRQHKGHANFSVVRPKQGAFVVRHFAGPVTYTAEGFLEKNRDQLSSDLMQCLECGSLCFMRERLSEGERIRGPPCKAGADSSASKVLKVQRYSVSSEFRLQLQDLLGRIHSTVPHFVRCIKPNPANCPFVDASAPVPCPHLDRRSVMEQLNYQGVLEAIRVARAGFPVRFTHSEFWREFRCLASLQLRSRLTADGPTPESVRALVECCELQAIFAKYGQSEWEMGKTRVFLKQEPCNALRAASAALRHTMAQRLQAVQRCRSATAAFARTVRLVLRMQALARGAAARAERRHRRREAAGTVLQAALRSLAEGQRRRISIHAVLVAQSWARSRPLRRRFLADRARLVHVQRWWRSLRKRRRWRRLQENVQLVQRVWRGALGRREALEVRVHVQRRRVAARSLLRTRRRNLAHRAWLSKVMTVYRGQQKPLVATAPQRALIEELVQMRRECEQHEAEVARLKAEREQLPARLETLRQAAFLRFRAFLSR